MSIFFIFFSRVDRESDSANSASNFYRLDSDSGWRDSRVTSRLGPVRHPADDWFDFSQNTLHSLPILTCVRWLLVAKNWNFLAILDTKFRSWQQESRLENSFKLAYSIENHIDTVTVTYFTGTRGCTWSCQNHVFSWSDHVLDHKMTKIWFMVQIKTKKLKNVVFMVFMVQKYS